jgi:four helix bundle protein
MTRADDIQEQLIQFAEGILALSGTLPPTADNEHIARQLLRSGIMPAINHIEAHWAVTPAEIVSNIKIAVANLNENEYWLRSIAPGDMPFPNMLAPLIADCQQLQRILIAGNKYVANPANHQLSNYSTKRRPN